MGFIGMIAFSQDGHVHNVVRSKRWFVLFLLFVGIDLIQVSDHFDARDNPGKGSVILVEVVGWQETDEELGTTAIGIGLRQGQT